MLKRGIKIICILVYIFACSSCVDRAKVNKVVDSKKSNEYVDLNFKNYSNIYALINDSVHIYTDSLLEEYLSLYGAEWKIDSMLCINSLNDKLVTTINMSNDIGKEGVSDAITKLLGKKINGKWYFFEGGGTLVVPRAWYGKDEMHPLTFHELSQIARKEMLQSALIKNEKGEYVVNDKWIDAHFYYTGMCDCKTRTQYDSVHWYKIIHKWQEKIDTNEYKPLRRHKMNKPVL